MADVDSGVIIDTFEHHTIKVTDDGVTLNNEPMDAACTTLAATIHQLRVAWAASANGTSTALTRPLAPLGAAVDC